MSGATRREQFEAALNAFALNQFNRGRTLKPEAQSQAFDAGLPLREDVLAKFTLLESAVEAAEGMRDSLRCLARNFNASKCPRFSLTEGACCSCEACDMACVFDSAMAALRGASK